MRFFRHKREETLGAYNFGQYQIYVCTLSNISGEIFKGVTVLSADSIMEIPFLLTEEKAFSLSRYLAEVGGGGVPKEFKLKGSWANFFCSTYFKFSKIKDGMLKGRISLSARTAWVTVSPSSALGCSQAINNLFGFSNA